jgi:hypothetical protein
MGPNRRAFAAEVVTAAGYVPSARNTNGAMWTAK